MAPLRIVPAAGGTRLEVLLVGRLDEDPDFSAISWHEGKAVTFDVDGVDLMNSIRWPLS